METWQIIRKLSDLGVSQSEMAEKSGVSQGRISQILSGEGDCSFSSGKKLSELLNCKEKDGIGEHVCRELSKDPS